MKQENEIMLKDALEGLKSVHNPRVTEQEFINIYLPLVVAKHSNIPCSFHQWVEKTGSIKEGVIVTDDRGNEMFTTPGIFPESSFTVDSGTNALLVEIAEQASKGLPVDHVYNKHLNANTALLSQGSASDHTLAWYGIFSKYGYKMVSSDDGSEMKLGAEQTTKQVSNKSRAPRADIGWEEEF